LKSSKTPGTKFMKEMYVGHNLSARGFRHIFGYTVVGDHAYVVVENPENGNNDVKNMSLYDFLFKYYKNLSRDKRMEVGPDILYTLTEVLHTYVNIHHPFIFKYNVRNNQKDVTMLFLKNIEIVFKDTNVKSARKINSFPQKVFNNNVNNTYKIRITNVAFNIPYSKVDDPLTNPVFFQEWSKFNKYKLQKLGQRRRIVVKLFHDILLDYLKYLRLRSIGSFNRAISQYYSSLQNENSIQFNSEEREEIRRVGSDLRQNLRNNLKRGEGRNSRPFYISPANF
jgi:hypothetical protein